MGDDVMSDMAPRSATWLLGCLLPADKEAVIGDLIEEHALLRSSSSRYASWWYWNQVALSLIPFFWSAVRRGRWLGVLGAAFVAYVFVTVIESATLATSRLFITDALMQERASFVIGLAATALGGYLAASIRRWAAATLAVMVACIVTALMITMPESAPLWYQFGFLVFGPLASLTGGRVWRRRCEPRAS
jgi:hypothetical protein